MPEGIVTGPGKDHFFSGSAADGTVFRCALDQEVAEIWLPAGGDGRDMALGMAVHDGARLVVCGGRNGGLFVYDLATRALVRKESVDGFLNDVCVVGDMAYVTDSSRPVLWRCDLSADGPMTEVSLAEAGPDAYLNGIVAVEHGLLVAAQGTETLWRVDSEGMSIVAEGWGADGLLVDGDVLYGMCNVGETHEDAVFFLGALRLSDGGRKAEDLGRFIDERFDTPTTLDADGSRLLIVNAQFGRRADARPPFQVIVMDKPI